MPTYENNEKELCEGLVRSLSSEEQEQAACTSYAYYVSLKDPEISSEDYRFNMAMRFARRHLVAEKGDTKLALSKMKETLIWREENHINDLRLCYESEIDDSIKERMEKFRDQVENEYKLQESYVSGFDKQKRAILVKMHRTSPNSVSADHVIHTVYLVERAIACTEIASEGKEEMILSFCDFEKYSRVNIPSSSETRKTFQVLQDYYPERLEHHVIIWVSGGGLSKLLIKAVWKIVKVFLDQKTRDKVRFIFDEKNRNTFMEERVDKNEAMPFMVTGGTQPTSFPMKKFLEGVPFTCSVNEIY